MYKVVMDWLDHSVGSNLAYPLSWTGPMDTATQPLSGLSPVFLLHVKATYQTEASRCACAGPHLRGVAGEDVVGGGAAAAPAAPPPNKVALWPRSVGSTSQSASALPVTLDCLW